MQLNCAYFNSAYRALADDLINHGLLSGPRGLMTREILGASFRVNAPTHNIIYHPLRNLNYKFMVAEFLWILFGYDDAATIGKYNSKIVEFSDDGVKMWGAYGPQIMVNLPFALSKLKEDVSTRQAVVEIWKTPWQPTKDVPCTLTLQLLCRENYMNCIVNMRSSDIWLGLPYDFYVFSQLLNLICSYTSMEPGFIQFNLGSSHVYETNVEALREILDSSKLIEIYGSDRIHGMPPAELAAILNDPTQKHPEGWYPPFKEPWNTFALVITHPREAALDLLTTFP